jgi:2-hydroxyacyl-CoA lyase 1
MAEIKGADLLAKSLKEQGVEYMFGVVGFPVGPIAEAAQKVGLPYIGMRNEQAASYAAGAVGYLTQRPGSCIVVTGPGVIHGLSGLANAQQNCWPMILIGGASETYRNGMGAFQEERQVLAATPVSKWAHAIEHVNRIPFYVEMAYRQSTYGRPGAAYLDIADDLITGSCDESQVVQVAKCPEPPRTQAMPMDIERALDVLQSAERPLALIGQGMGYSGATEEVRKFMEKAQIPFVRTPKGKGIMPDDHPLSAGAARTLALQQADVVFLMGARFNWILHFGLPPRYNPNVKVIQLDINPEAMHQNKPAEVALLGDGRAIMQQMNQALAGRQWFHPQGSPWRQALAQKASENAEMIRPQVEDNSSPGTYYRLFRDIREWLPKNVVLCSEGATTMDIGGTMMPLENPNSYLNAGSYGTMGVGLGLVVASCVVHPDRPVVHVSGDSAIGFSGMEMETLCRYGMPAKIVVLNNGGIGPGMPEIPDNPMLNMRPNTLIYGARYDKMMEAFGGFGAYVEDTKDVRDALNQLMKTPGPGLVNIKLSQGSQRKQQAFRWHT